MSEAASEAASSYDKALSDVSYVAPKEPREMSRQELRDARDSLALLVRHPGFLHLRETMQSQLDLYLNELASPAEDIAGVLKGEAHKSKFRQLMYDMNLAFTLIETYDEELKVTNTEDEENE